jgi:hypothetical protein
MEAVMGDVREMPLYRCHKEVRALEIDRIEEHKGKRIVHFHDDSFEPVTVGVASDLFARYQPAQGDFYMVYADGYESFSPRAAFLDGYIRV